MSVLQRATRRELVRQRWSYLGVAVTVVLGVALFTASYDAFLNLESSYRRTYERLAFADLTLRGGDVAAIAGTTPRPDGIAALTIRRTADMPIRVGGDHVMLGRLVEVPDDGRPDVGRVDVLDGSIPGGAATSSVLVERHMADHFGLHPGDAIALRTTGGWQDVDVAAVAASPEYLWPARSRQDVLTSADDFGVVFAPSSTFDALGPAGAVSEALVTVTPGVDIGTVTAGLVAAAGSGARVETRAEQPSNAALQEDVSGFGELSFMFPVLFLGAATMATFVLLSRLVRAQRTEIAALRANGVPTHRIAVHYLGQGVIVTTVSGVVGVIVGVAAGRVVTGLYTGAIDVPDTVTGFHVGTVVAGLVLAAGAGALAAAQPAVAAARTDPAAALGGITPVGRGGRSLAERIAPPLGRLPARWRMVLRGIGRDPRRSVSTVVGVVLAMVLILASWGMIDTVEVLLAEQFTEVQRQDAQVYVATGAEDALAAIRRRPGVERAETVGQESVVIGHGDLRYATELVAFDPSTEMHGFGSTGAPTSGVVAGRSLATLLDVGVGDVVTISAPNAGDTVIELPVEGFVDEPLGTFVYTDIASADGVVGGPGTTTVMIRFAPDVGREEMRRSMTAIPGVVAYVDSRALFDTAQSLLGLFYAFVGVMLAFGALMAFALVFATASANASERSAELASMRVNGMSSSRLAHLLDGENLLLTALAIVPGLVIGWAVSAFFMDSFSSDLFDFSLHMRPRTLIITAAAALAVGAMAHWPVSRMIARLDVARVVRERSR